MSQHQGLIDFQQVAASGVKGAYLRATMGIAGVDTRFAYNALKAASALPFGAYHLLRPEHDGAAQAGHFLKVALLTNPTLPYAVDVELDGSDVGKPQTPERIADVLRDFVLAMERAIGKRPAIYTGRWFFDPKVGSLHDALFATCKLWLAEYNTDTPKLPRGFTSIWLHQYTSEGRISGISGDVDMNRVCPARPAIDRRFIVPVDFPYVLSSGFNAPRNYAFAPHRKQLHEGADFAPTKAAAAPYRVIAPADGTVTRVDFDARGYGNYVVIQHADGFTSWLAHLSEPARVKVGAGVEIGQLVGYAGSTGGTSTGLHVHWTLQRAGVGADNYVVADVVDPLQFVMT